MRIVSLLPSATEILCELGLDKQLVGVTHECDYPSACVAGLPTVTQTLIPSDASSAEIDRLVRERLKHQRALYTLRNDVLESLQPDLIVTQALCDVCAVAESEVLEAARRLPSAPRVVNLEPLRLDDVFDCLRLVGEAAGVAERAAEVIAKLQARVAAVTLRSKVIQTPRRVVMLEWIDPPFCAGHWTPELVRMAGGQECIGREGTASTTTTWEQIVEADPEMLVIACCGFSVERTLQDVPLLRRQPGFGSMRCVRDGQVYVIDGSAYFNRPGPRLVDSLEILAHILHPEVHPRPEGSQMALTL